ncbi:MAG: hypothetical protein P8Y14_18245, partial [Anaerolineales bacterium]
MKVWAFLFILSAAGLLIGACWPSNAPVAEPSAERQLQDVSATDEPGQSSETPSSAIESYQGQIPTTENLKEVPGSKQSPEKEAPTDTSDTLTIYHLSARLDYQNHHLTVEEEIDYINRASDSLDDLMLIVEPSRYPDTFHLNSMAWEDGEPVHDYEREIGSMRLKLRNPLETGKRISLHLGYELSLPSPDISFYGRPVPFGYTSRQTNLVDWYPFMPPYVDGQGWLAHQAGAFGEHLAYEVADFEVSIELDGLQKDLTLAASAPAETQGEVAHYTLAAARSFAWSA